MELETRYGLEFNPFLKNSKQIIFECGEFNEAKFRLDYLAKTNLSAALSADRQDRQEGLVFLPVLLAEVKLLL